MLCVNFGLLCASQGACCAVKTVGTILMTNRSHRARSVDILIGVVDSTDDEDILTTSLTVLQTADLDSSLFTEQVG